MNDKINEKQQRLLEMTEHPELYSKKEIEAMLHDPRYARFYPDVGLD